MAYQLFYGNPFASGAGAATAGHAREKTEFARAVENAKLRLDSRRVSVQEAQQELEKSREERIREQQQEELEMRREQIERQAEEFEREQGIQKRDTLNELRQRGYRRAEGDEEPGDREVGFVGPDGQRYIGPDPAALEEQEARREQEAEMREQELDRTEQIREERNELMREGFAPEDQYENRDDIPDDYVPVLDAAGKTWYGPSEQAEAREKEQRELRTFRTKEDIRQKNRKEIKRMIESGEYSPRQNQVLKNLRDDMKNATDRRDQAIREREQLREDLKKKEETIKRSIGKDQEFEDLGEAKQENVKKLREERDTIRKKLQNLNNDALDAEVDALEIVRNRISADPGGEPPVPLTEVKRVDWKNVQSDGAMRVFESALSLPERADRRKAIQHISKIAAVKDAARRREAWNGLSEAINKTVSESR